jgi:hypothetical protein
MQILEALATACDQLKADRAGVGYHGPVFGSL